ncbi:hypothetical protein V6N11_042770 [Hibiscus sabdariffa]|uniref:Uncharacterized protein n=1 Tax=Hibiscus sabdariffa TaxID=183260 RepID=A0ABR2QXM3_9ROSI
MEHCVVVKLMPASMACLSTQGEGILSHCPMCNHRNRKPKASSLLGSNTSTPPPETQLYLIVFPIDPLSRAFRFGPTLHKLQCFSMLSELAFSTRDFMPASCSTRCSLLINAVIRRVGDLRASMQVFLSGKTIEVCVPFLDQ